MPTDLSDFEPVETQWSDFEAAPEIPAPASTQQYVAGGGPMAGMALIPPGALGAVLSVPGQALEHFAAASARTVRDVLNPETYLPEEMRSKPPFVISGWGGAPGPSEIRYQTPREAEPIQAGRPLISAPPESSDMRRLLSSMSTPGGIAMWPAGMTRAGAALILSTMAPGLVQQLEETIRGTGNPDEKRDRINQLFALAMMHAAPRAGSGPPTTGQDFTQRIGPPAPGTALVQPPGAVRPRLEPPPGLPLATPEEQAAAMAASEQQTAGYEPPQWRAPNVPTYPKPLSMKTQPAPLPRPPKATVPEGPAEVPETPPAPAPVEIRTWEDAVADLAKRGTGQETAKQVQAMYPQLNLKKEVAKQLKAEAFPVQGAVGAIRAQVPNIEGTPTVTLTPEAEAAVQAALGQKPPSKPPEEPPPSPSGAPVPKPPSLPAAGTPEAAASPVEQFKASDLAGKGNAFSNQIGLGLKSVQDLKDMLAEREGAAAKQEQLIEELRTITDPAERVKKMQEMAAAGHRRQLAGEVIQAATNTGAWVEGTQGANLGPRPLDWTKNPEVEEWLRDNAEALNIQLPEKPTAPAPAPPAPVAPAPEVKPAAPPVPKLVTDAVERFKREGDLNWDWTFADKAAREAVDDWLLATKHPSAFQPGTAEGRFKDLVRELAGKQSAVAQPAAAPPPVPVAPAPEVKPAAAAPSAPRAKPVSGRVPDIIDWLQGAFPGGVRITSKGDYGKLVNEKTGAARKILFKDKGTAADTVIKALRDSGIAKLESEDDLIQAILAAGRERIGARGETKSAAAQLSDLEQAAEAWSATVLRNERPEPAKSAAKPRGVDELGVGDKFLGNGILYTVKSVDPEGTVMASDPRGNEQWLEDGGRFYPDEGKIIKRPQAGGDLFGAEEMPFNLTGEQATGAAPAKPPEPAAPTPALTQPEMFSIQDITALKDPVKSADAAQKLYFTPRRAAEVLERQLAVIDSDPDVAKSFTREQRDRLREVIALLRQRAGGGPPGGGISVGPGGASPGDVPPPAPVAAPITSRPPEQRPNGIVTPSSPGMAQILGGLPGKIWTFLKGAAGDTLPKTTAADRTTGELGARYLASPIAALRVARVFSTQVLAGLDVDPAKFGAALVEDNLRSVREGFRAQATELTAKGQIDAAAAATAAADAVGTIIGHERSPFRTEDEYQDYLAEPATRQAIERHRQQWEEQVDPMYRNAQGIDPNEELPPRGQQTGARVNLKVVFPDEPGTRVVRSGPSLTATFKRKSPFARKAKGTGAAYEVDYHALMANTFTRQLEIANKNAFDNALVKSGNAVIGRPGQAIEIKGERGVPFPLTRRVLVQRGNEPVPLAQNIYVRKSLAEEYRAASHVDPNRTIPGLTPVLNAFNRAALAGLTDFTIHASNQLTALFNRPNSGPLLTDSLLSLFGRADVPITFTRSVLKSFADNQKQLSELAEIGALREPHTGINPLGRILSKTDQTTRLLLDDTFKRLVEAGLVPNTETARREYVNQIGQYNRRAQGPLMRLLRDTGFGPFATAGRTFNAMGIKMATLSPGVKAANDFAAAALRLNVLSKWVGFATLLGTLNYLLTSKRGGGMMGRPGVPLGNLDTGKVDEKGRPLSIPLADIFGLGRAFRVTGARGYLSSRRLGLSPTQSRETALRDVINSGLGPVMGPGVRAGFVSVTGYPAVNVPRIAPVAPPGQSQFKVNVEEALKDANPIVRSFADYLSGKSSAGQALGQQLPRFTMQPGKTPETATAYPKIVTGAELRNYTDYLAQQARQVPLAQRFQWVQKRMAQDQVDRALLNKALVELRRRGVFTYR